MRKIVLEWSGMGLLTVWLSVGAACSHGETDRVGHPRYCLTSTDYPIVVDCRVLRYYDAYGAIKPHERIMRE